MFPIYLLALILNLLILQSPIVAGQGLVIKTVLEQPLVTPGLNIVATVVELDFPAGDVGIPTHIHSGPVVGYVIEGDFLFQLKGGPVKIISAGSAFYEKDQAIHVWGANASNTTACKAVVTVFGRPGVPVLTPVADPHRQTYAQALSRARA